MEDKILILNQEYEQLLRDSEQIRTVNSLLETGREIPGWVLRAVCGLQQTASSPPPSAPENAEDKPVKAPATRRRIDKGKVLALHRAGWTNKAIAEEVRCSEASVSVIIKEEMK